MLLFSLSRIRFSATIFAPIPPAPFSGCLPRFPLVRVAGVRVTTKTFNCLFFIPHPACHDEQIPLPLTSIYPASLNSDSPVIPYPAFIVTVISHLPKPMGARTIALFVENEKYNPSHCSKYYEHPLCLYLCPYPSRKEILELCRRLPILAPELSRSIEEKSA